MRRRCSRNRASQLLCVLYGRWPYLANCEPSYLLNAWPRPLRHRMLAAASMDAAGSCRPNVWSARHCRPPVRCSRCPRVACWTRHPAQIPGARRTGCLWEQVPRGRAPRPRPLEAPFLQGSRPDPCSFPQQHPDPLSDRPAAGDSHEAGFPAGLPSAASHRWFLARALDGQSSSRSFRHHARRTLPRSCLFRDGGELDQAAAPRLVRTFAVHQRRE
jgi:hypothetical protein